VRLFGLEIDTVLVIFALLALFASRSVSTVFLLCIILTQNSILIRCSDRPSCCANSIRWVTNEVCQTTVNCCTSFWYAFLPLDKGPLADIFNEESDWHRLHLQWYLLEKNFVVMTGKGRSVNVEYPQEWQLCEYHSFATTS